MFLRRTDAVFPTVLQKMRVCQYGKVADIYHANASFCCYSDGCEASKSMGSNEICVKKGLH